MFTTDGIALRAASLKDSGRLAGRDTADGGRPGGLADLHDLGAPGEPIGLHQAHDEEHREGERHGLGEDEPELAHVPEEGGNGKL